MTVHVSFSSKEISQPASQLNRPVNKKNSIRLFLANFPHTVRFCVCSSMYVISCFFSGTPFFSLGQ